MAHDSKKKRTSQVHKKLIDVNTSCPPERSPTAHSGPNGLILIIIIIRKRRG
jgi:hypothetical protein